jgi:hypothetical protein
MANILAPFGFRHIGYLEGAAPTYGMRRRKIALGNSNPIFHGDPIVSLSTGYIAQASTNTLADIAAGAAPTVSGIFQGCEYLSISQGRKIRLPYWPGSDASADVDAFIIDAPTAIFVAQANGTPVVNLGSGSGIDLNCGMFIATGGSAAPTAGSGQGNTTNGLSGAMIDTAGTNGSGSGAPATGAALPFRIVDLYSNFVAPNAPTAGTTSFNGADNTTNYNWAIVTFNLASLHRGVLGI